MSEQIPSRTLGRTGVKVSALGLGGHHLGDVATIDEAVELVHEALDAGITFFDNCWEYYDGRSEDWLGRGLKGRRDQAFVMTKVCTHGRGAALAMTMLEQSLRRLQTDHLDLWQIHDVAFDNDPELAYAPGGVIEALDKAKQQGKTRFVGFTGHKNPAVHLKMLELGYRVRHRADAAQCLRRQFSQLRAARAAGSQSARHGGARHEELRRDGLVDQGAAWSSRRNCSATR